MKTFSTLARNNTFRDRHKLFPNSFIVFHDDEILQKLREDASASESKDL